MYIRVNNVYLPDMLNRIFIRNRLLMNMIVSQLIAQIF